MSGRGRLGPVLLVVALGALLYLPGLGREILRHPLEAKYALAAREMVRGGPWLVAHLFGDLYPDKPPLYFWATAAVAELRGGLLDEVSARLPAVLGGLATLVVTLALGEALFGARAGLMGAVVLATSGLFFWYARQGHPDQFLIAGVTLACLCLWRSFTTLRGPRRTGWIALAYGAMGLAVMSKGLLGLVLPLLASVCYLALTGPLRAVPGRLGLWPGLLVFSAVVLSWYGPAVSRHGLGYLRETIVHQQVERYARGWVHHGPWYQYLGDFTTGFLPWSLFLPGVAALAWTTWRGARERLRAARAAGDPDGQAPAPFLFPLCWFVAGFVFFSLSTGKRAAYLLPLYPAAAVLVGWMWAQADADGTEGRRSHWLGAPVALLAGGAALFAGAAAVLALGVLVLPRRLIPGRMVDTLVPADPVWQIAAAVVLLAGGAAVWLTWRRGRPGGDVRRDRGRGGRLPPRRHARPRAAVRGEVSGARAGHPHRGLRAARRARALAPGRLRLPGRLLPRPAHHARYRVPRSSGRRCATARGSCSSTTTTAPSSPCPASRCSRRGASARSGSSSSASTGADGAGRAGAPAGRGGQDLPGHGRSLFPPACA